jgi:hypothetical protein
MVRFMPRPLYPRGKSPRYPLDRKLGRTKILYRLFVEERINLPVNLGVLTRTFGTISTELI